MAAAFATVVWTWLAGKDAGWDFLNHHLYLPFAWLTGRIESDFFGAGTQSYQNPLGYIPPYLMIKTGWPDWMIGLGLALLHALAAVFTAVIAARLWRSQPQERAWVAAATALAWITPVFLIAAGTTSTDPLSAALTIAALLLITTFSGSRRNALIAGVLLGLAFSIKQSNAAFVIAAAAATLVQVAQGRRHWTGLAHCGLGGAVGIVAGMGWYSGFLWQEFGNPVFPLFNNVFQSPYAPAQPLLAQRFIPATLSEWLTRPFEMVQMKRYVYQEAFAPDLRPALALTVATVGLVLAIVRRFRTGGADPTGSSWTSTDTDLAVFSITAYVAWMATSGNGRYAIALLMLTGVWVARLAYLFLPGRLARMTVLVVLILQPAYFLSGEDFRSTPTPWTGGPYVDVRVPPRLRNEPFLHLTVSGVQTNASIAAYFHPAGALINPIGQLSLPMEGPIGNELRLRFAKWEGRTRVLLPAFSTRDDDAPRLRAVISHLFSRFGFAVDWNDCLRVRYEAGTAQKASTYWLLHTRQGTGPDRAWFSCALRSQPVPPKTETRLDRMADAIFARLETECPQVYGPRPFVTEQMGGAWERLYPNSDVIVTVSEEKGVRITRERALNVRYIGTMEEVAGGGGNLHCTRWLLTTPD
ncbi:glycosyltransferase 87 family protein [Cognatilysobacter bugurensis]|uniref:DUF2029 domain-containing protein n=1 Tax=Cognatilysobacter bugurensis TaxID=543356 RepID=A0A918T2H9_9GAMM|nr:glycosyltransferase 87 family protein [Lysobacter bugurensis]GHA84974.1 hypothetical protein GCM10007067_23650 [Lysobacter bugurensis]